MLITNEPLVVSTVPLLHFLAFICFSLEWDDPSSLTHNMGDVSLLNVQTVTMIVLVLSIFQNAGPFLMSRIWTVLPLWYLVKYPCRLNAKPHDRMVGHCSHNKQGLPRGQRVCPKPYLRHYIAPIRQPNCTVDIDPKSPS